VENDNEMQNRVVESYFETTVKRSL